MARTPDGVEQLALPFPQTRAARARRVASRTGSVLGRVLQVALRWLFRLALPLLCAAALLQAFPYHATVQGVPFEVQGTLFTRLGLAIGLAVAAALGMAVRYLRGRPRERHELRRRALGAGAAVLVTLAVAG